MFGREGKRKSFMGARKMLPTLKKRGRILVITCRISLSHTFIIDIQDSLKYFKQILKTKKLGLKPDYATPEDKNLPLGNYIQNVTVCHYQDTNSK